MGNFPPRQGQQWGKTQKITVGEMSDKFNVRLLRARLYTPQSQA